MRMFPKNVYPSVIFLFGSSVAEAVGICIHIWRVLTSLWNVPLKQTHSSRNMEIVKFDVNVAVAVMEI